jgi:hypothetical protein
MIVVVVLFVLGFALIAADQIRMSRMSRDQRAALYRRGGLLRQPQDAKTYVHHRFLPAMCVFGVLGILAISLAATSQGPDRLRGTLVTALFVVFFLAAFSVIGRLTYKRIADDQSRGLTALHDRGCSRGLKPPVSSSDLAM